MERVVRKKREVGQLGMNSETIKLESSSRYWKVHLKLESDYLSWKNTIEIGKIIREIT